MPFNTTGKSHHTGVSNEKMVCDFLNSHSKIIKPRITASDADVIQHVGGTKTKADAEIVGSGRKISIKHHKTGTFDWTNSTSAIPQDTKQYLKESLNAIIETDVNEASVRKKCNELFKATLMSLTTNDITGILKSVYESSPEIIIITLQGKRKLVAFELENNLLELKTCPNFTYYLRQDRAATSAKIWRKSNATGEEINTNLRIRLVLNNGVKKLMNKQSSVPCIKIQQDNVKQFIENIDSPIYEDY
jgi:hypothetical protein